MSDRSCRKHRVFLLTAAACLVLLAAIAPPAAAQASSSGQINRGAIHFSGGLDVPSVYIFRGILQETDPRLTLSPYGEIDLALRSGDGLFRSVGVSLGVWNSLQTGSSGSKGPSAHLHYREDFHSTLTLGFGGGVLISAGYAALTSPNNMFDTIKEAQLKVATRQRLNPYGLVAVELTRDGQADNGTHQGTYLELGVSPGFALTRKATLTIPARVGLSVQDYYELAGQDHRFGFFDVGVLVTLPLRGVPERFGRWQVHGGVDVFALGEMPKVRNQGQSSKVVGALGIALSY